MIRKSIDDKKYAAYRHGYEDAKRGVFAPPKGDSWLDLISAPFEKLIGSPRTRLPADEKAAAYLEGHAAYGNQW